ncbi:MAG: NADPH-dependent F420 reductase [Terriglobales bacterium]
MKIGIIGAGRIGGTLTRRFAALGHEVAVANSRGPESLAGLAGETGARAVSVPEAAHFGEVVVVTIPLKNVAALPAGLLADVPASSGNLEPPRAEQVSVAGERSHDSGQPQGAAQGGSELSTVAVVDTCNYYPRNRDGRIAAIEAGMPESRWVEQQLAHPVIKAFNNIFAQHLMDRGLPEGAPGRIALPVAGDDEAAKAKIMELVNQLGFDPVDAGGLDQSWRQQPGSPVYAADFDAAGVVRALAQASPERRSEWRAA